MTSPSPDYSAAYQGDADNNASGKRIDLDGAALHAQAEMRNRTYCDCRHYCCGDA